MSSYTAKEKKIKDLTAAEFKHLIQKSIAEDIDAGFGRIGFSGKQFWGEGREVWRLIGDQ